jgi:hypothetical protein
MNPPVTLSVERLAAADDVAAIHAVLQIFDMLRLTREQQRNVLEYLMEREEEAPF